MNLGSLTGPQLIFPDLPGRDVEGVLRAFAQRVAAAGLVDDADRLYEKLQERETLGSTGIGSGVAIPHCKMKGLDRAILAVGIKDEPVDYGAVDEKPVRLFFLVVSPDDSPAVHLQVLASISRWVKTDRNVEKTLAMSRPDRIYEFLLGEES